MGRAETKFGDKVHFLPERIFAAAQKGKGADDLLNQCLSSQKDYIHEVCVAARYAPDATFRDNYAEIFCGIARQKMTAKPAAGSKPATAATNSTQNSTKTAANTNDKDSGGVAGFFKGIGNSVGNLFSGSGNAVSFDDCKT